MLENTESFPKINFSVLNKKIEKRDNTNSEKFLNFNSFKTHVIGFLEKDSIRKESLSINILI